MREDNKIRNKQNNVLRQFSSSILQNLLGRRQGSDELLQKKDLVKVHIIFLSFSGRYMSVFSVFNLGSVIEGQIKQITSFSLKKFNFSNNFYPTT